MLEFKEAYKGQLGNISRGTAFIYSVVKMATKVILTDPLQVCVRIEKPEHTRLFKYCEDKKVRPLSLMGMILQSGIKEFLDYDKSLEDAGKVAVEDVITDETDEKEAFEQLIKAHDEEVAKEKKATAEGKKVRKVSVDLKK